ncbi:MAG: hypothetical protein V3T72_19805, partial [Thermoanaerobaculia bacterium]
MEPSGQSSARCNPHRLRSQAVSFPYDPAETFSDADVIGKECDRGGHRRTIAKTTIAMLALALTPAVSVQAQTNLDEESGLQFNFTPPGARSLALGGAFSGLADDATAAVANPAGLIQLSEPEVSVEFRRWEFTNTYFSGGEYVLPPGNTTLPVDDSLPVTRGTKSTESSTEGVSFLSFVYPKDRFAVAVYRTQVTDFESRINPNPILIRRDRCSDEVFGSPAPTPTTPNTPSFARQCNFTGGGEGFLALDISSIGIAGAFKFTKGLSLGFTMASFDYQQTIISGDEAEGDATKSVRGDDTAVASSIGVLWKPKGFESGKLSVGFVYRQGPEFNGVAEVRCNAIERVGENGQLETVVLPERACRLQEVGDGEILKAGLENNPIGGVTTFKVPDTWS